MIWLYIILAILASLVLGFFISLFIVMNWMFDKFFKRDGRSPNTNLEGERYDSCREVALADRRKVEQLPHEMMEVTAIDGVTLKALFYKGEGKATVILMHGANSRPLLNFSSMILALLDNGYDVLAPYERACGESGGLYLTYGHLESDDLISWVRKIKEEKGGKIAVYGISLGAEAIAFASDRLEKEGVSAAILEGCFISIDSLFMDPRSRKVPKIMRVLFFRQVKHRLGIDGKKTVEEALRKSRTPSYFIHGKKDTTVLYQSCEMAYGWCGGKKKIFIAPDLGHAVLSFFPENRESIIGFIEENLQ